MSRTIQTANDYSGLTVANAGTLVLSGNNSGATNGTIVAAGGTLQVGAANNFTAGALTLNGGASAAALNLWNNTATDFAKNVVLVGTNNTINVDNAGVGAGQTHKLGTVSHASVVARTLTVASLNGYSLTVTNFSLCPSIGQTSTLVADTKVTLLDVSNPMSGYTSANYDTLTLGGAAADSVVTGAIKDASGLNATNQPASLVNGGTTRLTKNGTGTWTLFGANTYSGITTVSAGTLKSGNAAAFAGYSSTLAVNGTGILDLNGFNATFAAANAGAGTATITDNGTGSGTSTLAITNQGNTTISTLITDGATRKVAVTLRNNNPTATLFTITNANTFSGGLLLLSNTTGTRLRISASPVTVGGPGAIDSSPFGTGAITIGQTPTDRAGILLDTINNIGLVNDLVFNTALGTDQPGLRSDTTGNLLAGKITANLAPAMFASGPTQNGGVILAGQVSGANGLSVVNNGTGTITVTLSNATVNANNYAGDTTIRRTNDILTLALADQIPNGAGKGNVTNSGALKLNGFNETINGLSGTGTVDGVSGSPTLTLGDNNASGSFSGVIKNTAGSLSLAKMGTGTQTLSGASTYTGLTTVGNGTLVVSSAQTGGGAFVVNDGTTLGVVRDATTTALAVSSLTLGSVNGATNSLTLPAGSPAAQVITAGTLTLNGINAVAITGANFTAGQFPLIKYTTKTGSGTFAATLLSVPSGFTGMISNNVANSSMDLVLASTMPTTPTNITYSVSGSTLTLTWPSSYLGWYAQSNSVNVATPEFWSDIAGSQLTTNLVITVNPAQTNVFYRLRLP